MTIEDSCVIASGDFPVETKSLLSASRILVLYRLMYHSWDIRTTESQFSIKTLHPFKSTIQLLAFVTTSLTFAWNISSSMYGSKYNPIRSEEEYRKCISSNEDVCLNEQIWIEAFTSHCSHVCNSTVASKVGIQSVIWLAPYILKCILLW